MLDAVTAAARRARRAGRPVPVLLSVVWPREARAPAVAAFVRVATAVAAAARPVDAAG